MIKNSTNKIKYIVTAVVLGVGIIAGGVTLLVKTPDTFSISERRQLAKKPKASVESVWAGKFMGEYESYVLDQFPFRDAFRGIKAWSQYNIFRKKDNNGIYMKDGYLSKLEYPKVEAMQDHAIGRFENIYNKFLEPNGITPYLAIIPDKNYYLASDSDYLTLDYDELFEYVYDKTPFMKKIEIKDLLSIDDFYYTDTHWRQECVIDVADRIVSSMNDGASVSFEAKDAVSLDEPFNGVYVGQSALKVQPDQIKYITNDVIEGCTVTSYDTGKPAPMTMYDFEKAKGNDGYDFFLSGANALIVIENPNANTDKELIIFRDSYGSSLTPLMVENYSKITLVDIRYIQSDYLNALVEFDNQDVLFMYSTMLLNNSLALK